MLADRFAPGCSRVVAIAPGPAPKPVLAERKHQKEHFGDAEEDEGCEETGRCRRQFVRMVDAADDQGDESSDEDVDRHWKGRADAVASEIACEVMKPPGQHMDGCLRGTEIKVQFCKRAQTPKCQESR